MEAYYFAKNNIMKNLSNEEKWKFIHDYSWKLNKPLIKPSNLLDWGHIMKWAIFMECKISSTKHKTEQKAFNALAKFCYDRLGIVPENQLNLFDQKVETCACGKNPACVCEKK